MPQNTILNETFVGIDVSKQELVVHIHPQGECFTSANTPSAIRHLLARFGAIPEGCVLPLKHPVAMSVTF